MGRVVHFEIHAEDPQRAKKFYETVFLWEFTEWGGQDYWIIKTGEPGTPGIDGGMVRRRGIIDGTAVIAYVCTIDVLDLDTALKLALDNGGTMALDKMPVPGVGWLAYCKDTEGNIFGMMQHDPQAA